MILVIRAKVIIIYLKNILKFRADIKSIEANIEKIDEELKSSGDAFDLVEKRKQLEKDKEKAERELSRKITEIAEKEKQKRLRINKIADRKNVDAEVEHYQKQIDFVEQVVAYLKQEIADKIREYSETLQTSIQSLVDDMLTSKRSVVLNEEFQLQVKDSYNDESKSEGQFAVVSFAYIGGILKVLHSHEQIRNKEYPLVLDGPFSKLDPEQKGNVIKTIPQYAPQVIIFSKDPLGDYINSEIIGKIYTIVSNDEKNDASIKEGLPKALKSFFDGESYEDVVRNAVSLGGDTDTLAAIAGAMAETFYGMPFVILAEGKEFLPEDMLAVLKRFDEILGRTSVNEFIR